MKENFQGYMVMGNKRQKAFKVWPSYFDAVYEQTSRRVSNIRGRQEYKIVSVTVQIEKEEDGQGTPSTNG